MTKQLSLFEKLKTLGSSLDSFSTSTKTAKRSRGDKAEEIACNYLKKHNLVLEARNFSTRAGEVDLIMRDKNDAETLIFIEVRYRKNSDFGGAVASVTPKKQRRIIKAALTYQQQHAPQSSMRFDVVAIEGDNIDNKQTNDLKINWIESAFNGF